MVVPQPASTSAAATDQATARKVIDVEPPRSARTVVERASRSFRIRTISNGSDATCHPTGRLHHWLPVSLDAHVGIHGS